VDGSASNDGSNLLEEIRVAYLLHRLNSSDKAPSGYDILKMATMGSARLLGREKEIGSLETGKCADLFLVKADRLELVGAMFDPGSVLGTVGLKGAVDYTIVNGEVVVENGRLARVDEEKLSFEAGQQVKKYLGR
jgi:cytosine/adenosine deaminase-related metal-dependent hydrolase